jgi:hypothetical protein
LAKKLCNKLCRIRVLAYRWLNLIDATASGDACIQIKVGTPRNHTCIYDYRKNVVDAVTAILDRYEGAYWDRDAKREILNAINGTPAYVAVFEGEKHHHVCFFDNTGNYPPQALFSVRVYDPSEGRYEDMAIWSESILIGNDEDEDDETSVLLALTDEQDPIIELPVVVMGGRIIQVTLAG